ncbi:trafficking protein particle complex subunit 12-like [Plakobranchus ocellatus]|uniref:Trafficking protein particle complex subunit 12-like n=1 Tax=Plakobranchus ocellatus TaxID=259542 RepID=A0AAV4BIJ3_9GAST|nr:trafficking protein particle complex subunit 12-like [Plakobranchus ocellatus]
MTSPKDDFVLEDDEEDASGNLQIPHDNLASMVSSPTTDTLDSVALEPSAYEDIAKLDEDDYCIGHVEASENQDAEANNKVKEEDLGADGDMPVSNLSSYFADSGDDFFDSLGGVGPVDSKLGNDLFMSIAISKSDEDIRASEMNATEIKESDIKSSLSTPNDETGGMRRENSFLRKSEEMENEKLYEELEQSLAEASAEQDTSSVVGTKAVDQAANPEAEESLTRIHHKERTTSACEPETIAFEGEMENLSSKTLDLDLQLDDMDEDEIEEMVQESETPKFMTQLSRSSDHSASEPPAVQQAQKQQETALAETTCGSDHVQGPMLSSTPSYMSPMVTPNHRPLEATTESLIEETPSASAGSGGAAASATEIKNRVDSQSSLPSSPFHQPSSEVKGGSSVFGPFGNNSGAMDDAFSSILNMSDSDRRHDAWIPSDATSHILKTMVSGGQSMFVPAVEQLSTPGILSNEPQGDPVRDLVLRYMGEQEAMRRSVLTVESVTQDVDGLKKLMDAGCLRAAIDLTGRLLDHVGQGYEKAGQITVHTPHSLQLWFCRLTLMVKLRMYDTAEAEMRAFQTLDTPDLYFQYYLNTYPGRRGSMVSFPMRLLHAELPLLCGRSQETLDRLYYMLAVCTRIKSNLASDLSEDGSSVHMTYEARKASIELWSKREVDIIYKIGSTMLSVKDYEGALAIYNSLIEKDKNSSLELMAGIGRIHLQMGSIAEATRIMKEVETESAKTDSTLSCHNLINRGLVAMCGANFFDAYQHFKSAVQMQPHNTCAVNNMAVCSLYLGRLKDALNTLEQLVHSDPASTLHEGVLFNLCTLYELETSRALHKKQAILDLVSKHKGDGFPVACLKMA